MVRGRCGSESIVYVILYIIKYLVIYVWNCFWYCVVCEGL